MQGRLRRWLIIYFIVVMAMPFSSKALAVIPSEVVYTPQDRQIFDRYVASIAAWRSSSIDTLLQQTALFFLDTPYVAHTLESDTEEKLVVNLREFDCTTFVESVIALARTARSDQPDFAVFLQELRTLRYRGGTLGGYASRLHYTSDWLYDNEKKGILKNISLRLGGMREEKKIDFMSTHREAYPQLKNDDALLKEMTLIENNINAQGGYYYLPQKSIAVKATQIPAMSMVAFTTRIKGLDVTHMGFAFHKEQTLTFIHASSTRKKVVIDTKSLSDYCATQSTCTGIIVAALINH